MPFGLNQAFAISHDNDTPLQTVGFYNFQTRKRNSCAFPYYHFSTAFGPRQKSNY